MQSQSRRTSSRREIIICSEGTVRIKEGKYKGEVVSGGKRMYVAACAARSKGFVNIEGNEECLGCTKWIDELKKI